jgi:hypothetical protein
MAATNAEMYEGARVLMRDNNISVIIPFVLGVVPTTYLILDNRNTAELEASSAVDATKPTGRGWVRYTYAQAESAFGTLPTLAVP